MTRRAVILLGVPVLVAGLAAFPLGLWRGEYQWLCAAVALALTVPPGLVTLVLAERLGRGSPLGPVAAMAVGTFVRLLVGFGGAAAVFFGSGDTFRAEPVVFWAWLLAAYLLTLTVEMALLGGAARTAGGRRP